MRCYMINLFEKYDEASQKLQQSLQLAGFQHQTIVMDDDGFLPDGFISPYQFFANYEHKYHYCGKLKGIMIKLKL